jgi:uncharacterized tellurite resistance protein B-like protein
MEKNYQLGLLYFIHLLISADGVTDKSELAALNRIKSSEKIPAAIVSEFEKSIESKTDQEIYQMGLSYLRKCSESQKLKVFAILYQLSEIDGMVHTKEIRLLLYSAKTAGIEFNEVVDFSRSNPTIF